VDLDSATILDQVAAFERIVMSSSVVSIIVDRMPELELPGCYLAAGALCQTVWNHLCGHEVLAGIKDYDIAYFDAADLSAGAEQVAMRRVTELFEDLDVTLDVRNQARVHLWYEDRFGVPCPAYRSTQAAIATFPSTSSAFGVRRRDGELDVFAPYGFTDLFALRSRPNPLLAPRDVYEAKTARWRRQWPRLEVIPWPSGE
jgi:hypothetical protein